MPFLALVEFFASTVYSGSAAHSQDLGGYQQMGLGPDVNASSRQVSECWGLSPLFDACASAAFDFLLVNGVGIS